jgi:branched-subunit amino acid aminotransferase/4-amino-4-deoxychorismate lyase
MLNSSGNLVCSTAGNLFLITQGKILTPPITDGALPGIMRGKIIQQHKDVKIQSLTIRELENAEAIFITNSLIGAQIISDVEGKILNAKSGFNILIKALK